MIYDAVTFIFFGGVKTLKACLTSTIRVLKVFFLLSVMLSVNECNAVSDEDDDMTRPLQYKTYVHQKSDYEPLIQNHQLTEKEKEWLQQQTEQDQQEQQKDMEEQRVRNINRLIEEQNKKQGTISIETTKHEPLIQNHQLTEKEKQWLQQQTEQDQQEQQREMEEKCLRNKRLIEQYRMRKNQNTSIQRLEKYQPLILEPAKKRRKIMSSLHT